MALRSLHDVVVISWDTGMMKNSRNRKEYGPVVLPLLAYLCRYQPSLAYPCLVIVPTFPFFPCPCSGILQDTHLIVISDHGMLATCSSRTIDLQPISELQLIPGFSPDWLDGIGGAEAGLFPPDVVSAQELLGKLEVCVIEDTRFAKREDYLTCGGNDSLTRTPEVLLWKYDRL